MDDGRSTVEKKSFQFAIRIVKLYQHLNTVKKRVCYFETAFALRNKYRR